MLTVTKTPLRVSLFGGGTDYPEYFASNPGAVIGFTINKYIYIASIPLPGSQDYAFRFAYSKIELVDSVEDITHPAIRAGLKRYTKVQNIDVSIMSDMPASSGLGSSSAFVVGLLSLFRRLNGVSPHVSPLDLAREAIAFERDTLQENVGVQDQLHAACGGVNRFDFVGESIRQTPISLSPASLNALNSSLVLVHTGRTRRASEVVEEQVKRTMAGGLDVSLKQMYELIGPAEQVLTAPNVDLRELGRILNESWKIKRTLTSAISNDDTNNLYDHCIQQGAYGGKLCGAGGGGYLLMLVDPARVSSFLRTFADKQPVTLQIEASGSKFLQEA